jgi:hypothetical protein
MIAAETNVIGPGGGAADGATTKGDPRSRIPASQFLSGRVRS